MKKLYPLKFEPLFKTVIWGGKKIHKYKGVNHLSPKIGESWELSGVKDNVSIVSNGYLKGRDINSLISEFKEDLLGDSYSSEINVFPLLIKFIGADDNLSIQVHPNDEIACKRHGARGKTEMWYVVDAEPNAYILSGFTKQLTKQEYVDIVNEGRLSDVLTRYYVKKGDVFFLPAGRVHTICKGCLIAEIQQTSDITYRIYDYNRKGFDGKPRELHTELALDAIDFTVYDDYQTHYPTEDNKLNKIITCNYFTANLLKLNHEFHLNLTEINSFVILMCVEGETSMQVYFSDKHNNECKLSQGETMLIPACATNIVFKGNAKMLVVI